MEPSHYHLSAIEKDFQEYLHHNDVTSRLVSGGIAGAVAKTAIAPLERVKMSFQVSQETYSTRKAIDKIKSIIKSGGFFALWKGHSTTIIRVLPYAGLSYAIHDTSEMHFKKTLGVDRLPSFWKFAAGSIGGIGATVLTYPLDVLRVRLALIPGSTWKSAMKQGGLFQGMLAAILGVIPYTGTGWLVKQTLTEIFPDVNAKQKTPHVPALLLINGAAGLVGQFVSYPLDIVRRRMQMTDVVSKVSIRESLRHLLLSEGGRGLTKAFSLNFIKGPITISLSFTTYDIMRKWINGDISMF